MTVRYEPTFEYTEAEAKNLGTALQFMRKAISRAKMPVVRHLVCSCAGGSYAELSETLRLSCDSLVMINQRQATTLLKVAEQLSESLSDLETRKLRTWLGSLINDVAWVREERRIMESMNGKQRSLANTSTNQSRSRTATR